MAVPDSKRSDTHSAVRALWNTRMEKDILGDFSTFHFAGKALHFPAVMVDVQAAFGQGSFIHCLEHRHRGTTTTRSRHWWAPCLAFQWKQELRRNTPCVSAPCRCLRGREQKKTIKLLSWCVWGYTISVSSCSCPSPPTFSWTWNLVETSWFSLEMTNLIVKGEIPPAVFSLGDKVMFQGSSQSDRYLLEGRHPPWYKHQEPWEEDFPCSKDVQGYVGVSGITSNI